MTLNKMWVGVAICVFVEFKYLLASRLHTETMMLTKLPSRVVMFLYY